jgi:histone H2A
MKKGVSKSKRAGLVFPVGRISRFLQRGRYAPRIGGGAPVFLAGALEYLVAEILRAAGEVARQRKRHRITPNHILLGVKKDFELNKLLNGVTISQGGVVPRILKILES